MTTCICNLRTQEVESKESQFQSQYNYTVRVYLKKGKGYIVKPKFINITGGLTRYGPHRFMCRNAWTTGSGTIKSCELVGESVLLWGQEYSMWHTVSICSLRTKV